MNTRTLTAVIHREGETAEEAVEGIGFRQTRQRGGHAGKSGCQAPLDT